MVKTSHAVSVNPGLTWWKLPKVWLAQRIGTVRDGDAPMQLSHKRFDKSSWQRRACRHWHILCATPASRLKSEIRRKSFVDCSSCRQSGPRLRSRTRPPEGARTRQRQERARRRSCDVQLFLCLLLSCSTQFVLLAHISLFPSVHCPPLYHHREPHSLPRQT